MSNSTLAVRPDEQPWTAEEIEQVRAELLGGIERLAAELKTSAVELQEMLAAGVDGAGNDQADIGSTSLERDAEMSLAANQRVLLEQSQKALERLDDGSYGVCENCDQPIGKLRLMAFPRATLCMACKQKEERR